MPTVIRGSDNIDTSNVATQTELDVVDGQLLGVGQTWQNVTGSRVATTIYTNTTGRPIYVAVYTIGSSTNPNYLNVNGIAVGVMGLNTALNAVGCSAIVPIGGTYSVTLINGSIAMWAELR